MKTASYVGVTPSDCALQKCHSYPVLYCYLYMYSLVVTEGNCSLVFGVRLC